MKEIVIIAGPNGSGKSTLAEQLNLPVRFINADMYEKEKFSHLTVKEAREQGAAVMAAKTISEYLKNGKSFAFETVFSADDNRIF